MNQINPEKTSIKRKLIFFILILSLPLLIGCGETDLRSMGLEGKFAFKKGRRVFVMDLSTGQCRKLKIPAGHFALSPDGKKIAYEDYGSAAGLWIADLNGKNRKKLTTSAIHSPNWSPDGKKIAFCKAGTWTPDGKEIIYLKDEEKGIYIIDIDGKNEHLVITFPPKDIIYNFDWSPDGKKFVFCSSRFNGQIYTVNVDGSDLKRLTTPTSGISNEDPDWSPDGEIIVFTSYSKDPNKPKDPNNEIYIMNADGSNQTSLTDIKKGYGAFTPKWTPDGIKIIYWVGLSPEPIPSISYLYMMNPDASNKIILTKEMPWELF